MVPKKMPVCQTGSQNKPLSFTGCPKHCNQDVCMYATICSSPSKMQLIIINPSHLFCWIRHNILRSSSESCGTIQKHSVPKGFLSFQRNWCESRLPFNVLCYRRFWWLSMIPSGGPLELFPTFSEAGSERALSGS